MIPKLHAKGHSFKGCIGQYLLHDKNADTAERVEWIQTHNLPTGNAELGWRLMAATAMDADRLKEEAGISKRGRQSKAAVLHFSLSWHEDEAEALTKNDMVYAALDALSALGADDRQAMIIAHNDEPHPHVHVVVNRVSMEDGRMLSSSKEKLNLSTWAEDYERKRGEILCKQRQVNNEFRRKGLFVRGKKDVARHIFEAAAAGRRSVDTALVRQEQRKLDAQLARRGRDLQVQQRKDVDTLDTQYAERRAAMQADYRRAKTIAKDQIVKASMPGYSALADAQRADQSEWIDRENASFGWLGNFFRAKRLNLADSSRSFLNRVFNVPATSGARLDALLRAQGDNKRAFEQGMVGQMRQALKELSRDHRSALARRDIDYQSARTLMLERHRTQTNELQQAWRDRNAERKEAFVKAEARAQVHNDFTKAASPAEPKRAQTDSKTPKRKRNRNRQRKRTRE